MSITTSKTLSLIAILVIVLFAFIPGSFVSRKTPRDPNIPPVLESRNVLPETVLIRCDWLVFVLDANGNIYNGKNIVGSLANPVVLTTKVKEAIEARASQLAYSRGMDLNLELPLPRCVDEPVYAKASIHANDSRMISLVAVL